MFEKNQEIYCHECYEKNKKDYDLIIDYIKLNPGATVMDVITSTEVALKSVNCFIEDGSISYITSSAGPQQKRITRGCHN